MTFDTYFRLSSYATVVCGALALYLSGGMGVGLACAFLVALAAAWKMEGKRWQMSERVGLVVLLLALPLIYVDWKYQTTLGVLEGGLSGQAEAGVTTLVHLTLLLSVIKLWQVKADRDWLFLYLISFFEVLLAAGLSVSPMFLAALGLYLFAALLTVVCFELRKAQRLVPHAETRLLVAHDDAGKIGKYFGRARRADGKMRALRRLPLAALFLLALVFALALPIFFITPRSGGSSALALAGGGATGYVGFSDSVTLGDIGRLQRQTRIVMRVRVDDPAAERNQRLRWRGVALDDFDGRTWRRSKTSERVVPAGERDLYQFGTTEHANRLTRQTFFVEPIDTSVLFVAPRAVAVQGALPFVGRDEEGALSTRPHPQERLSYRAYSDTVEPPDEILRADLNPYAPDKARYLKLPNALDTRVSSLARDVILSAGARNRYDAARAIETHLSGGEYGYTLDMRAGGRDPLADFLFRVRAGHCEYFSTAMAVMLRTQGIAARVVNGFQTGEYNDASDAYTVRQSDAHSWVEVYFPQTDSWVMFDPTPPAGRTGMAAGATGFGARLGKYAEALELFWIQYVVAYDRQEQRSLANTLRGGWGAYRDSATRGAGSLRASLASFWGGLRAAGPDAKSPWAMISMPLILAGSLAVLFLIYFRRRKFFTFGKKRGAAGAHENVTPVVTFYERMLKALDARGLRRESDQTPLEFATATGMHEALVITTAYHRVRYGADELLPDEVEEIENSLQRIEEKTANSK